MRTHIAKSLQSRCQTIRTAIAAYNTAAAALSPPRPPLDWTEVSHYGFIEEFALLQDTRNDVREKPWAKPIYREILKLRHRIAHAHEEITRCNVQIRRLYTSICDQTDLFSQVLTRLCNTKSDMHGPLRDFVTRRQRINLALLRRVQQVFALEGYTGQTTRGTRLGTEEPHPATEQQTVGHAGPPPIELGPDPKAPVAECQPETQRPTLAAQQTTPLQIETPEMLEQSQGLETTLSLITADDEDADDEDVENDDEFTRITQGVENFVIGIQD